MKAGAKVNLRDKFKQTPLHAAARESRTPAVVKALLDAGADPAARNKSGKTPFDYAKENPALKGTKVYGRLKEMRFRVQVNPPRFTSSAATPSRTDGIDPRSSPGKRSRIGVVEKAPPSEELLKRPLDAGKPPSFRSRAGIHFDFSPGGAATASPPRNAGMRYPRGGNDGAWPI